MDLPSSALPGRGLEAHQPARRVTISPTKKLQDSAGLDKTQGAEAPCVEVGNPSISSDEGSVTSYRHYVSEAVYRSHPFPCRDSLGEVELADAVAEHSGSTKIDAELTV